MWYQMEQGSVLGHSNLWLRHLLVRLGAMPGRRRNENGYQLVHLTMGMAADGGQACALVPGDSNMRKGMYSGCIKPCGVEANQWTNVPWPIMHSPSTLFIDFSVMLQAKANWLVRVFIEWMLCVQ